MSSKLTARPRQRRAAVALSLGVLAVSSLSACNADGDQALGNPFGDGHAAQRCVDAIRWRLGVGPRPADWQPSVG